MAARSKSQPTAKRAARSRKYDPERTKRDILSVATKEFAKHGFNGERIDAIAERTATTKRMIYYFGTDDYTEMAAPGGHIGTFVGGKAQKILAPTLAEWFKARSG